MAMEGETPIVDTPVVDDSAMQSGIVEGADTGTFGAEDGEQAEAEIAASDISGVHATEKDKEDTMEDLKKFKKAFEDAEKKKKEEQDKIASSSSSEANFSLLSRSFKSS